LNFEQLQSHYQNPALKSRLDKWMREEQGWTILDDPEGIRDNLERAAKFACYALVNKLVFHEALLKRYAPKMNGLAVPEHIDTGDALRQHLERYFAEAKDVTGDYETVFGEDHTAIGNVIPFYSDSAVPHWRELINQIHQFDFSRLDYEIIGNIFERLISPEERHKYGQFYTRVEVVDLINSFCIRKGDEKVMDPACGGGTFLVRAYARKKELNPLRNHGQLLSDLFGVDVSHFATHLTTINLATRDLIDEANYPQIARSDFFDISANRAFVTLPTRIRAKGLGKLQHREVTISPLDAVVGNPPYLRQEEIPRAKKSTRRGPERGTKDYYQALVLKESGARLSGRSDIHCYFWPHASSFLKDNGYLCLLTSSQWLDVEYGFHLQDWMLRNFRIIAIFESIAEPWFVGARVATTATILQHEPDEAMRMDNDVRFVQLRRPLREILAHDGTTAGAVSASDEFRNEILNLKSETMNERYRLRLIPQRDLWNEGVRLGKLVQKTKLDEEEQQGEQDITLGDYYGGKWGIHLRAPDLWFELLDTYGDRMVPLVEIAEVHRGITSGKDVFFFPRDCSSECIQAHRDAADFHAAYGVPRRQVESGEVKLVRCGEGRGEIHPIESEYLEPEVHSLMEIKGFTVKPEDCSRMVLLISTPKARLRGKYVLDYIKWGEKQGYHKGETCASRITSERQWYDLTRHKRGALFWSKSQQYKHVVPSNQHNLQCNCNLYDIYLPSETYTSVIAGILNSSLVALSKFLYGRPVGVEGNFKTEIVDVEMMLVPDPRSAPRSATTRVSQAFERVKNRETLYFLSERRLRRMAFTQTGKEYELVNLSDKCELDMPDRRELDNAVLELLGVESKERRHHLIDELYDYLRLFFEWTRQKEELAIANKKKAKRHGPARPAEIATQIYAQLSAEEPYLLHRYDPDFIDMSEPFDTYDLPTDGTPERFSDMFTSHGVRFSKDKKSQLALIETRHTGQDNLIVLVASSGVRGLVRIPCEKEECRRVLNEYERFTRQRNLRIRDLIEERTADDELQEKVYDAIMHIIQRGHH